MKTVEHCRYWRQHSGVVTTLSHPIFMMMLKINLNYKNSPYSVFVSFSVSDLLRLLPAPLFCLSLSVCLSVLQLTLTPAQQQLLIQQAQAQLLAAAVQHSANQQSSTTGANISASAATPITQLPLSQPIQITSVRHTHGCQQVLMKICKAVRYMNSEWWKSFKMLKFMFSPPLFKCIIMITK